MTDEEIHYIEDYSWEQSARECLDALVEAVYLYEIPVQTIFAKRPELLKVLKKTILEKQEPDAVRIESLFNRRVLLYRELTGKDILEFGGGQ
jgi:hypothetical protein